MQTAEAIRRRLDTAEGLRSIVRTMKTLAIVSIRQYEDAVRALDEYSRTVDLATQALIRDRPAAVAQMTEQRSERLGVVVFGADQGLCGAFSEQIATRLLEDRLAIDQDGAHGPLLAIGTRVANRLEDGGLPPTEVLHLPASAPMMASLVGEILGRIDRWRASNEADAVHLYYNRPDPGAIYRPHHAVLLPLDAERLRTLAATPWRPRGVPALAAEWETLLTATVQEYLFVTLQRALAESLASEHAARRAAMHAAERNLDDRLAELRGQFNQQRQSAITSELLDIVSGYEVLTGEDEREVGRSSARL